MAPRGLPGAPGWLPGGSEEPQGPPVWPPGAPRRFKMTKFFIIFGLFHVQNPPKMRQHDLQKPSQGATTAKRNDFETCCFVLVFAVNLENLAPQDGPKTAKKPLKVLLERHQEPFQKASLQPASPLHVLVPDLPRASRRLPGASQRFLRLSNCSGVAPRWLPGAPGASQVAPRGSQVAPRCLPGTA